MSNKSKKPDKKVLADKFIQQNPHLAKWLHSCSKCEQQGYKPIMPNPTEPNIKDAVEVANWNAFRTMRQLFKKMPLNRDGVCESCFMGSIVLPPTLHSFRNKVPKELSHVLQTTDFLTYMDGKIFDLKTGLFYSDIKKVEKTYCALLSVRYRGDHNKYLDNTDHVSRIEFHIGAIERQYRKGVREFLTQRILPFVSDWLIEQINAGVQNDNVLRISSYMPSRSRWKCDREQVDYISISEHGKETRRYVRPWDKFAA